MDKDSDADVVHGGRGAVLRMTMMAVGVSGGDFNGYTHPPLRRFLVLVLLFQTAI